MSKARVWSEIARWTFKSALASRTVGGVVRWKVQPRTGYEFPAEPSLLGEVLLRGFGEGA